MLTELQRLLTDANNGVDEVAELLRRDAGLTARVVRIANGIVFNRGDSVGSLEGALGRIGYEEVHRMAGAAVLRQMASMEFAYYPISEFTFCRNSLLCAFLMEELADYAELDPKTAYTTGLLRSIGKLLMDATARAEGRSEQIQPLGKEGLLEWEQQVFGLTHPEVATAVLRAWRFPVEVFMPIRDQYLHSLPVEPHVSCRVLNLVGAIAEDHGWGLPGELVYWSQSHFIQAELRLSPDARSIIEERAARQARHYLNALNQSEHE
ncbi:MAG: HDOD domain-containing protein [Opitutaceae bacterium]|nr:HDOD domain-containing protein [Opitutaceae bacterium]